MFFNNSSNRGLSGAQISKLKLILYYEHLRAKEMAQAVKYSSYNHEAPIGSPGPMENTQAWRVPITPVLWSQRQADPCSSLAGQPPLVGEFQGQ